MTSNQEYQALNSVKYLFLRQLSEPRDNSLLLVVQEAIENRLGAPSVHADDPELSQILTNTWPIESVEGCKTFELTWKRYATYLVTEELVGSAGDYDDEQYTGNVLRIYTKSHFLDHLATDTGGHIDPIVHHKLICLNHLIDVASYAPPEIRLIESDAPPPARIH